jgi:thiol:disulfide interchange protein DsbC
MYRTLLTALFVLIPFHWAVADSGTAAIKAALSRSFPKSGDADIRPAPIAGLYQVELDGQVFYASADGKFIVLGDMWELGTHKNLTEAERDKIAAKLLAGVSEKNMIVIGPADAKRTITVFTDVDCPFCARLHQEVPELNRNGVRVRYLFFPRSGLDGETYKRSVAVWCAADRVKAIGIAKAGGALDMKTCPNPVADEYRLGERLGVNGTPTIFLENGRRIGGYVPAANLLALLGLKTTPTAVR